MKYFVFIVFGTLMLSCSEDRKHDEQLSQPGQTLKSKSLKNNQLFSTDISKESPITPLRFGVDPKNQKLNLSDRYYSDLIYKDLGKLLNEGRDAEIKKNLKQYRLPPIKKIDLTGISYVDTANCNDGRPFGDFMHFSHYRYRLPDVNGLQCYYWCNYNDKNYPEDVIANCTTAQINYRYGNLILYDPRTQNAHVIFTYIYTYWDGMDHIRRFYIDKNYNIWLTNFATPADDNDTDGGVPDLESRHLITISKRGEISVKKISN